MPGELYGIPAQDIDAVAERLGAALSLPFERRESSFWGPYASFKGPDSGGVRVYYNEDPMHDPESAPSDEQFFKPEHRSYRVLLDAELFDEVQLRHLGKAIRSEFPGCVLTRHREA